MWSLHNRWLWMTSLTVVPAIHQQCVAVLSQLHNWDSKKAKCWNPTPKHAQYPTETFQLQTTKSPLPWCLILWSTLKPKLLKLGCAWHSLISRTLSKGHQFCVWSAPSGVLVRGTSTIQESPHFWRVHECQTLWGPFSQLIIVYKICGTTGTARANAFAANPTFASIGSRISFDMLKSLRRDGVFLLYKT